MFSKKSFFILLAALSIISLVGFWSGFDSSIYRKISNLVSDINKDKVSAENARRKKVAQQIILLDKNLRALRAFEENYHDFFQKPLSISDGEIVFEEIISRLNKIRDSVGVMCAFKVEFESLNTGLKLLQKFNDRSLDHLVNFSSLLKDYCQARAEEADALINSRQSDGLALNMLGAKASKRIDEFYSSLSYLFEFYSEGLDEEDLADLKAMIDSLKN